MWDALKSDLFDFVNTIQSDTSNTLQKVLGEDELNQEESEQTLLTKLIADLKRSYETYSKPLKENKAKDFEKYKKKFSLSGHAKEIASVLDEEPEVSRFYAELVPIEISPEEFWARLFFRLHLLTRNGTATFEDDDEEEELVWEEDAFVSKEQNTAVESDTSSLFNQLEQKNTRIKNLEEENQDLKNQIKSLISQISHLEIALSKCEASKLAVVQQDDSKAPLAIETASVSSSEGSSIMLVNYPQETREKSLPLSSEVESKVALVSLEDEEDEDGWN